MEEDYGPRSIVLVIGLVLAFFTYGISLILALIYFYKAPRKYK